MKIKEIKKLLDKVARDTIQGYLDRLEVEEPDIIGMELVDTDFEEEADWFLDLKLKGITEYEDESGQTVKFEGFSKVPLIRGYADWIIEEYKAEIPDNQIETFCHQTAKMLTRLLQWKLNLQAEIAEEEYGDPEPFSEHPVYTQSFDAEETESITLRELIEKFIHYKIHGKKAWPGERTIKGNTRILYLIHRIFEYIKKSEEVPVDSISKDDAHAFNMIFRNMPKNLTNLGKKSSFEDVLDKVDKEKISENRKGLISDSRFNTYIEQINGMFNYACASVRGYAKINYFSDMRIANPDREKRQPFTSSDLNKFFSTDLYSKKEFPIKWAWRYWLPIIMMYTGARSEEICQLHVHHIKEHKGINYFDIKSTVDKETGKNITSVKNAQSNRFVPIHPTLVKIGFLKYLKYLKESGEEQVFPNLKNRTKKGDFKPYSKGVSRWFNENDLKKSKFSYLVRCGVNAKPGEENKAVEEEVRKNLYCFKHTVETLLINHPDNIEHDKIDSLLGHKIQSTGRKHYGEYHVPTLYNDVVKKIDYPDANLPWDVDPAYNKIEFPWQ
ncbi:site-specific integrase [Thermodesulfobacteriota bacterium]